MSKIVKDGRDVLHRFVGSFIDFPKPLVGLVHGPAVGISVTTLALYDCVLASDKVSYLSILCSLVMQVVMENIISA